jgi:hypothetical protein
MRPYLEKNPSQKKGWGAGGVAEGEHPEFKPSTTKKRRKSVVNILDFACGHVLCMWQKYVQKQSTG